MKIRKIFALIFASILPLTIYSGSLEVTQPLSDQQLGSVPESNISSMEELLSIAKSAIAIPANFKGFKENIMNLIESSECINKTSDVKCQKIGCKDKKSCVGTTLGHLAEFLQPAIAILLGKTSMSTNNQIIYNRGLITSSISLIPKIMDKLIKLLDKFASHISVDPSTLSKINKVKELLEKTIIPKLGSLTNSTQSTIELLLGLAIALNPEAALEKVKSIEVPPITIANNEQDTDFEDLIDEDFEDFAQE